MKQGLLGFQYEIEKRESGLTGLGGLPTYLELMTVSGMPQSFARHVKVRSGEQGYTDPQVITSLVMLNLAGGDRVEDLRKLEEDEGFNEVLRAVELQVLGLPRKERRELERRFRKERKRAVPSPSATFRYLEGFHCESEENRRKEAAERREKEGKLEGFAFIPEPNEHLKGLWEVNKEFMNFVQKKSPKESATLDMDATLIETFKKEAYFGYKGFKAYQPLNVYWAEQELMVYSEFRDGNVPAGYGQLPVLKQSLKYLPEGIKKVLLRTDTAGYEVDLLKFCAEGKETGVGVIEFAIGVDVTPAFKKAVKEVEAGDWQPLCRETKEGRKPTGQEWAEVCFVPNSLSKSKKGPEYRFLAIREPMEQLVLPGMEKQEKLPFPTMEFDGQTHKVFGMVTNRTLPGEELIWWHRERCGKSEEAHSVMKEDLAGGTLPSGKFGENAAWWAIMILAFNLNSVMKRQVLGGRFVTSRLKAIRYHLINISARVLNHARTLLIRLSQGNPSYELVLRARQRLLEMAAQPSG